MSMVSFVIFQSVGDRQKTRKNLDISKLEICARVHDFLFQAFEQFYIVIWLCMLLKDVLEILPSLMPKTFSDQFVFVRGCEQCTTIIGQFTCSIYYYLKDLDWVHFAWRGLPYGDKDQTLFVDDELSKALRNPNGVDFSLNHSKDANYPKTNCNG
jgi:hypothetical protein